MRLIELLAIFAYEDHPEGIQLASGEVVHEYLNCRAALSRPHVLTALNCEALQNLLPEITAVGGMALGALPMAVSLSLGSLSSGYWPRPLRSFYVRDSRKDHGTKKLIEGAVREEDSVCLLEDVVTTGDSLLQAAFACQHHGLRIAQMMVLVDREQNGLARIRDLVGPTVPITVLTTLSAIRACARARAQA